MFRKKRKKYFNTIIIIQLNNLKSWLNTRKLTPNPINTSSIVTPLDQHSYIHFRINLRCIVGLIPFSHGLVSCGNTCVATITFSIFPFRSKRRESRESIHNFIKTFKIILKPNPNKSTLIILRLFSNFPLLKNLQKKKNII